MGNKHNQIYHKPILNNFKTELFLQPLTYKRKLKSERLTFSPKKSHIGKVLHYVIK